MGFLSFCAGCISVIGKAIGSVASGIARAVGSLAPALVGLGVKLSTAAQLISIVCKIVGEILKILTPEEKVEEVGERALQAEENGITLESCTNDFNVYMQKIRNLKLDPEKIEKRPKAEQILAGCLIIEKGIEQFAPKMATAAMWPILIKNPEFFNADRLKIYAEMALEKRIDFGDTIAKYFASSPGSKISSTVSEFVWNAEEKYNPKETPNQIREIFSQVEKNCLPEK